MDGVLGQVVDFERYPLDEPDTPELRALVTACRTKLDDPALYLLPGEADSGGDFGYVPYVRAGTLTLFRGDESIHQVTEIGAGSKRRMIAVFRYDQAPNMVFPQQYIEQVRSLGQGIA